MFHVIMTSGVVITLREGFKILEGKTIIIKMLHFKYYLLLLLYRSKNSLKYQRLINITYYFAIVMWAGYSLCLYFYNSWGIYQITH